MGSQFFPPALPIPYGVHQDTSGFHRRYAGPSQIPGAVIPCYLLGLHHASVIYGLVIRNPQPCACQLLYLLEFYRIFPCSACKYSVAAEYYPDPLSCLPAEGLPASRFHGNVCRQLTCSVLGCLGFSEGQAAPLQKLLQKAGISLFCIDFSPKILPLLQRLLGIQKLSPAVVVIDFPFRLCYVIRVRRRLVDIVGFQLLRQISPLCLLISPPRKVTVSRQKIHKGLRLLQAVQIERRRVVAGPLSSVLSPCFRRKSQIGICKNGASVQKQRPELFTVPAGSLPPQISRRKRPQNASSADKRIGNPCVIAAHQQRLPAAQHIGQTDFSPVLCPALHLAVGPGACAGFTYICQGTPHASKPPVPVHP